MFHGTSFQPDRNETNIVEILLSPHLPRSSTTIVMMCIAYNVSGGHFNPAISVGMFLAQKKFGEDLLPLILMVVAQFAGAFFGILLGFFAVIDSEYQDKKVSDDNEKHANVPSSWVSFTAFLPKTGKRGNNYDDGLNC